MKILVILLLLNLILLPSSRVENSENLDIQERIENGEKIQEQVLKLLPDNNPLVRGQLTDVPVVSLFIPRRMWNNLSREEQIDYTYFAQSLIPTITQNPEQYVDIPRSAPLYVKFLSKTLNLCSDCWSIIIGDLITKNGKRTITSDEVVVQGDTPWAAGEACCRGVNASDFRQ